LSVHEKIDHDLPFLVSWDLTLEHESLSGQEVEHKSDGLETLVVGWNGNINELKWGIRVAKCDDWDVHVGGFLDGLVIGSWVTDDDKSWLLELLGVLVGKRTGGPFTSEVVGTGVIGELEDSSLSVLSVRDDKDILGIVDSGDDSSSNHHLLPGLGEMEEMETILGSGVDVWLHLLGAVHGSDMDIGSEHEGQVSISGFGVTEVCSLVFGGHFCNVFKVIMILNID